MVKSRRHFLKASTVIVGSFAIVPARALIEYPTKPIKIIVAAAPGSPSDIPARMASQMLRDWGSPWWWKTDRVPEVR
jgi:tripartite-type tricarboxylate transporter receptor subunit TctC